MTSLACVCAAAAQSQPYLHELNKGKHLLLQLHITSVAAGLTTASLLTQ